MALDRPVLFVAWAEGRTIGLSCPPQPKMVLASPWVVGVEVVGDLGGCTTTPQTDGKPVAIQSGSLVENVPFSAERDIAHMRAAAEETTATTRR